MSSDESCPELKFSADSLPPITAPTSNPINNNPSSIKDDQKTQQIQEILSSAGIDGRSQTLRSLQYLNSIRNRDSVIKPQNPSQNKSFEDTDDLMSDWMLTFLSPLREKQYKQFVIEQYVTSIRVALLSMIISYIFLVGTNGSFVNVCSFIFIKPKYQTLTHFICRIPFKSFLFVLDYL